jgi:hypothetical protein
MTKVDVCKKNKILRGDSKQGVLFIWGPKRGPIHGVGLTISFCFICGFRLSKLYYEFFMFVVGRPWVW